MNNHEMADCIKKSMSPGRYIHTIGVAETAVRLAEVFGADVVKAETAALLHDIVRDASGQELLQMCEKYSIIPDEIEQAIPELLHGKVGAAVARERFGIVDGDVLDAVRWHTTGRKAMSLLDKIIFLADMVEPGRNFPGVEALRQIAYKDLDRSVVAGIDSTLRYVIDRAMVIHPSSIEARNELLGYSGAPR